MGKIDFRCFILPDFFPNVSCGQRDTSSFQPSLADPLRKFMWLLIPCGPFA